MNRYEEYKDTGIGWLPKLPSHWKLEQLRKYIRLVSKKGYPEKQLLSVTRELGVIIRDTESKEENHNFIPDDLSGYKYVKEGQFVINKMKSWQGSYGVSAYEGIVSPAYYVCDLDFPNKDFFGWAIRSRNYVSFFAQFSKGIRVGQWDLSPVALKSIPFFDPPLVEQEKIVRFLESKTLCIDAYVAERERELQLLNELKESEIANIITRGLNPDVKMKDSGIPWIGMIPEHWEVKRIASLFTGKVATNSDFEYQHAYKFNYGTLVPKDEVGDIEEYRATYVKYSIIQKGDILINGLNLNYDFVSQRVAIAPNDGIITSAYIVARPRRNTNSEYYNYLFKTMDNKKLFHGMGTGIRLTLSFDELKKQLVPVPTPEEQCKIVAYIEEKCKKVNSLIDELNAEIEYLKEYKQKLIADCVTGQINVQSEI